MVTPLSLNTATSQLACVCEMQYIMRFGFDIQVLIVDFQLVDLRLLTFLKALDGYGANC